MKNPIMQEIEDNVDIVPYNKWDRGLQVVILLFVVVNCVAVLIQLVWGI